MRAVRTSRLPSSGFWCRSRRQAMTFASRRSAPALIAASNGKGVSGAFMGMNSTLYNRRLMEGPVDHLQPQEAHKFLKENPDAVFIDCRSEMEYMFVGHPIGAMMVPWYDGAEWELNPHFVGQGRKIAGANFHNGPIELIYRSGNRTIEAAAALPRQRA